MKTFPHVEDYLEILAGMRDITTGKLASSWFLGFSPVISLARYDENVLQNMSETTVSNKPLTEKQGKLLVDIILKYKKQFAAKMIDVSPVETPVWRLPLRVMDYTKRLGYTDGVITIRFPFDTKLIESVKEFRKQSQGKTEFDRDEKMWKVAMTEYNLNWLHTWAKANSFEIDSELDTFNNLILETEKQDYKIELTLDGDKLNITNCPDSLRKYIEANGGFSFDNLTRLIDLGGVASYTVDEDLINAASAQWGTRFVRLATNSELSVSPTSTDVIASTLKDIVEYAEQVNRLPIVIFEPDMSGKLLGIIQQYVDESEIMVSIKKRIGEIPEGIKYIHTTAPIRDMEKIPLMITGSGMIYGGEKQIMVQRCEKIVYVANDVYNSTGTKPKRVVKLL